MSRFRERYGAPPLHLLALVASFAVAGYAVLKWFDAPQVLRLFVWFAGAVIAHDLILYPFYALVDRALVKTLPVRAVNYVRVPALLAGLLLLLWWPLITGHPEAQYRSATGLGTSPYQARYLLVVAALFGLSALLYAARLVRAGRGHRATGGGAGGTGSARPEADTSTWRANGTRGTLLRSRAPAPTTTHDPRGGGT